MSTSFAALFLLAVLGIFANVGCDYCCEDTGSGITAGPPGPIIDVDPNPDNGGKIDWKTTPAGSTTATVQAADDGPIYTNCLLRKDFIGGVAMLFKGCLAGSYQTTCTSEVPNLKTVRFVNPTDGIWITVSKDPADDRISWQYFKRATLTQPLELCPLISTASTPGHLPDEFGGLTEIWDVSNPQSPRALTDFQMQVRMWP